MAKKEKADKSEEGEKSKKARRPGNKGGRLQLVMIFLAIAAIVFLPTSIVMIVGMMPSIVAFLINGKTAPSKVFGIAAMNLAGVSPFLLALWRDGQNFEKAIEIISNPQSITVMYATAAMGHMIVWVMGGIVGSILYESGKRRSTEIEKRQKELIERWGEEVNGTIALDQQGFPLSSSEG